MNRSTTRNTLSQTDTSCGKLAVDDDRHEILDRSILFDGFNRLTRLLYRYRKRDGGWSEPLEREIFQRGPAAAVLPYDPVRDTVVMVEQFRPGALLSGKNPWQVEPIAGICDADEAPEETVRREAMEEAGCTLERIVTACTYLVSPGCVEEKVTVFCASTDSTQIAELGGMSTEQEETLVHVLDFETCLKGLHDNRFTYALTIVALQWLALHRDGLRRDWL